MVCHQALSTVGYCSTWLVCRCCFKTRVLVHFDKCERTTITFKYKPYLTITTLLSWQIQSNRFSWQTEQITGVMEFSTWYWKKGHFFPNNFMHFKKIEKLIMLLPCLACFLIQWEHKTQKESDIDKTHLTAHQSKNRIFLLFG